MDSPPRNFAFKGAVERLLRLGKLPLLVLFTTLYGLVKGENLRQLWSASLW